MQELNAGVVKYGNMFDIESATAKLEKKIPSRSRVHSGPVGEIRLSTDNLYRWHRCDFGGGNGECCPRHLAGIEGDVFDRLCTAKEFDPVE